MEMTGIAADVKPPNAFVTIFNGRLIRAVTEGATVLLNTEGVPKYI